MPYLLPHVNIITGNRENNDLQNSAEQRPNTLSWIARQKTATSQESIHYCNGTFQGQR